MDSSLGTRESGQPVCKSRQAKEEKRMALSKERKEQLAEHLRGTSVAKENITPEYRKNLELADKETVVIPGCG